MLPAPPLGSALLALLGIALMLLGLRATMADLGFRGPALPPRRARRADRTRDERGPGPDAGRDPD